MGLKKDYTDYNYQDVVNVVLDKGFVWSTLKLALRFGEGQPALQDLPNSEAQRAYGLIQENLSRYQALFIQNQTNTPAYQQPPPPQAPPAGGATTVIEREVVKIKCRYCGALNDETSKACSSCGATL